MLGSEHSVAFFASGEKTASCVNKSNEDTLDSSDVLLWALRQTCAHIIKDGALWASQGENFDRRSSAWKKFQDVPSSPSSVRDALLEPEARSLEELYSVQDEFHQYMSDGTSEPRRGSYRMRRKRRDRSNVLKALNLSTTAWTQPLRTLVESGQYPTSFEYVSLSKCLRQMSKAAELRGISDPAVGWATRYRGHLSLSSYHWETITTTSYPLFSGFSPPPSVPKFYF